MSSGAMRPPSWGNRALQFLIIVGGLAFTAATYVGARAVKDWVDETSLKGKTRYERSLVRAMKAEGVYRQYLALARQLTDSQSAATAMAAAVRRGITLLEPEDQARRIDLLDHRLATTRPRDCAAMERGSLAAGRAMVALINRMDSSSMDVFAAIVARSFKLAQKHPDYRVPRIHRNETSDFLRAAGTVLEEPEKTRYFATMRA